MKISRIAILTLVVAMALGPASAMAQEMKSSPSIAERRNLISSHLLDIEDILSADLPGPEFAEYVRRIRDLADMAERAQQEPSAKIEMLQRKLGRIRSAMGGAVETPDEDSRAAFEAEERNLRREEARLLAEISRLRNQKK